jgi:hypothetical protein
MNVKELITELEKMDPDLLVVHSTGLMQDHEEVIEVFVAKDKGYTTAWTKDTKMLKGGDWIIID